MSDLPAAHPMRLVEVLVGQPQTRIDPTAKRDPEWTSAIWKSPVEGPVAIGPLGLAGDAVANPQAHGGIDKAVLAYSVDWAGAWQSERPGMETTPGAFGENLAVQGADETTVCRGDRWIICHQADSHQAGSHQADSGDGDAVELEVSHPRQPCWKLARRHQMPDLPKRTIATARTGWYLRVLGEGTVAAGASIELAARPHPDWPLDRVAAVFYGLGVARNDADSLARHEAAVDELRSLAVLAEAWREAL